ncbi:DUF4158 domain-containing protein [Citrobacter freundii]|nr:DUF4158 domain-containing protein [Citrobacter freundii]
MSFLDAKSHDALFALPEIYEEAVIAIVAEQLDIDPAVFTLYAQRKETRREHAPEIFQPLWL